MSIANNWDYEFKQIKEMLSATTIKDTDRIKALSKRLYVVADACEERKE